MFPSFEVGFIVNYDRYFGQYRLYIPDLSRSEVADVLDRCLNAGYHVSNFAFIVERDALLQEDFIAAEVVSQYPAEVELKNAGNPPYYYVIPAGVMAVSIEEHLAVADSIAGFLRNYSGSIFFRPVLTRNKKRRFSVIESESKHAFIAPSSIYRSVSQGGKEHYCRNSGLWASHETKAPDEVFLDSIAVGVGCRYHPLIVTRTLAIRLREVFPAISLEPIFSTTSRIGSVAVGVCDLLNAAADFGRGKTKPIVFPNVRHDKK